MRRHNYLSAVLHGARGSRPVQRADSLSYGGHTTCIELRTQENFSTFIDGGTGIVNRGRELIASPLREHHLLVTHTHWDHVLGYPYFAPLFDNRHNVTFYAAQTARADFRNILGRLPGTQHLKNTQFKNITPDTTFTINGVLRVSAFQLNHPGVTLAYRIHYKTSSCVIITDTAPLFLNNTLGEGMQNNNAYIDNYHRRLREFLRGAHTVIYDSHFTTETLRPDWGHSTPDLALAAIQDTNVKRLVLFHHAPEDSDAAVNVKLEHLKNQHPDISCELVAAKEGDEWPIF